MRTENVKEPKIDEIKNKTGQTGKKSTNGWLGFVKITPSRSLFIKGNNPETNAFKVKGQIVPKIIVDWDLAIFHYLRGELKMGTNQQSKEFSTNGPINVESVKWDSPSLYG